MSKLSTLDGYTPKSTLLLFEHESGQRIASAYIKFGGWNAATQRLTPIQVVNLSADADASVISWVFDSFAAAVEAGKVDGQIYLQQLFASAEDLEAYIRILEEAGDTLWVNDRHFYALEHVAGFGEEFLMTYATIAEALANEGGFAA